MMKQNSSFLEEIQNLKAQLDQQKKYIDKLKQENYGQNRQVEINIKEEKQRNLQLQE